MGETQATTKNWMGSLLEGQRDAGGQMYMRNRYYDPATSQFTQTDPIGIAGGLNTYGYANADPVTFADPYGLQADTIEIDDTLRPWMDKCSESAKCRTFIDSLATDNESHRIRTGQPGECYPYKIGCWEKTAWGSTIIIIPGELNQVTYLLDESDVIGHEMAHDVVCQSNEPCAINQENIIRSQRGRSLRPTP